MRERLTTLLARARGMGRTAWGPLSDAVMEACGRIRSRLEDARVAAVRKRRMRVVESLSLGGRRQLLLVRCDEQEYLVGTGPDSVETIVLRQQGVGVEAAGASQANAGPVAPLQTAAKIRSASAGLTGSGAMLRNRFAQGPWLVSTTEMGGVAKNAVAKNRVREAESGQGRESWQ
jgi:hypothetical protein